LGQEWTKIQKRYGGRPVGKTRNSPWQDGSQAPLDGASDHGVSEALYLRDPDQNGVEVYWDRPEAQWPRNADGNVNMKTEPLNLQNLLAEAKTA
jgi:catechol-2,3-dioxygenase